MTIHGLLLVRMLLQTEGKVPECVVTACCHQLSMAREVIAGGFMMYHDQQTCTATQQCKIFVAAYPHAAALQQILSV